MERPEGSDVEMEYGTVFRPDVGRDDRTTSFSGADGDREFHFPFPGGHKKIHEFSYTSKGAKIIKFLRIIPTRLELTQRSIYGMQTIL